MKEKLDIEKAWLKIQCYMQHMHYDWLYEHLEHEYQAYYELGYDCSNSFKDIVNHFPNECKLLFGTIN